MKAVGTVVQWYSAFFGCLLSVLVENWWRIGVAYWRLVLKACLVSPSGACYARDCERLGIQSPSPFKKD